MSIEKNQPSKKEEVSMQTCAQSLHLLLELRELYPKYTICQHLAGITRRKNPNVAEYYFWSDTQFLKRIENYKKELEAEQLEDESNDYLID